MDSFPRVGDVVVWDKGDDAECVLFIVSMKPSSADNLTYAFECFTVASNPSHWVCEHDGVETWTFHVSELDELVLLSRQGCAPVQRQWAESPVDAMSSTAVGVS